MSRHQELQSSGAPYQDLAHSLSLWTCLCFSHSFPSLFSKPRSVSLSFKGGFLERRIFGNNGQGSPRTKVDGCVFCLRILRIKPTPLGQGVKHPRYAGCHIASKPKQQNVAVAVLKVLLVGGLNGKPKGTPPFWRVRLDRNRLG